MKIYQQLDDFPRPDNGCVLIIGNFDGVHLGHQAIIASARQLAMQHNLPLVALTFEPAPVRVLKPELAPRLLTPLPLKTKLLSQLNIQHLIIINPTPQFLGMSPSQFIEQILAQKLNVRHIVEGESFFFGHNRSGSLSDLHSLAHQFSFTTHKTNSFTLSLPNPSSPTSQKSISSTLIRTWLLKGDLDLARTALSRDYILSGTIAPGRGVGKTLGFPTANLQLDSPLQLVPGHGVFAGYARWADSFDAAWQNTKNYPAAISIGTSPTFPSAPWQIEAFMLDYPPGSPDLNGQHFLLSFVRKIRDQKKFPDKTDLVQQIKQDIAKIQPILEQHTPTF